MDHQIYLLLHTSHSILVDNFPVGVAASGILIVHLPPFGKLHATLQDLVKFRWKHLVENCIAVTNKDWHWMVGLVRPLWVLVSNLQTYLARCNPSLRAASRLGKSIKDVKRSTYVKLCLMIMKGTFVSKWKQVKLGHLRASRQHSSAYVLVSWLSLQFSYLGPGPRFLWRVHFSGRTGGGDTITSLSLFTPFKSRCQRTSPLPPPPPTPPCLTR